MSLLILPALFLIAGSLQQARASFVDAYALSNFTFSNTNADGSVETPDAGLTVLLTGGNNGSGIFGITRLTIAALAAGNVSFTYLYQSDDIPGLDRAGYILSDDFTAFADTSGQTASVSIPVAAGQIFGFFVETDDNTFGAGSLTLSNFEAPQATGVPEPGAFSLFAIGGAAIWAVHRRRKIRYNRSLTAAAQKPLPSRAPKQAVCKLFLALILGLCTLHGLAFAQQSTYSGVNITGQLQLARVVNVMSLSQLAAIRQMGGFFLMSAPSPEYKPPVPLRRPVPGLRPVAPRDASALKPASFLDVSRSAASTDVRSAVAAVNNVLGVSPANTFGFFGLSHFDQRLSNGGNQFSVEPPNPSIAVANGYVIQGVNNAFQVYSAAGFPLLPKVLSTNELFGLPPAIDRSTGVNGPFPTDMRVFFDHTISRWIVLQRAQDYDTFGTPQNSSKLYLAVSQTADPTANYNIYVMDTTNSTNPGCPCLFDYPQIGADQYGFYISGNEFSTFSERFVNASILAISKSSLAANAPLPTIYKVRLPFTTGFEFAIQPATTPPGASPFVANGGLEYFVSSNATASVDNRLALWAMYNTGSLNTSNPNLTLVQTTISTLQYAFPDVVTQRPGPIPYGSSLGLPMAFIDGGDNRVLSVTYAGSRLYITLDTQVVDDAGKFLVGSAYVIVSTAFRTGLINYSVTRQGYLAVRGNHLLRSSIAVNAQGRGAIAFTLAGPDYFPSAAFVPIDLFSTGTNVRLAAAGTAPEDGFTGYQTGVARWGDYSGAVISSDGALWMVMQMIPSGNRTEAANWGTWLARFVPGT